MNYKIIFLIIGSAIIIIIGSIFVLNPMQEPDNYSNESENLEKQAIEIVQSYQGIDEKGENIIDAFRAAFVAVYPDQDIFLHPATKISWRAFEDPPFSNTYQVQFEIKTSQEDSLFIWNVNLDSKKVWSNQPGARAMLNKLDQT